MAAENVKKNTSKLFTNADGSSMVFFMRPCNERQELRPLIEAAAGKVTSKVVRESIKLAERGSIVSSDDYITTKYITDCINENKLLPLDNYRVKAGTRVRGMSEDSDASIHSFSSNDSSMSPASYIVQPSKQQYKGRSKYTKGEDIAMITFLIEENRYKEALGIRVWKDMELRKITNHSADSMNTRYRKHILPKIDDYKHDVDRRWLSKLTGGMVAKESEFSADALFAIRKKRDKPSDASSTKNAMTGGRGDVFDFCQDKKKHQGDVNEKSEKLKDMVDTDKVPSEKVGIETGETDKDGKGNYIEHEWKKKKMKENKMSKNTEKCGDNASSRKPLDSDRCSKLAADVVKKTQSKNTALETTEEPGTAKDTSSGIDCVREETNVDELEEQRSSPDIFEISDGVEGSKNETENSKDATGNSKDANVIHKKHDVVESEGRSLRSRAKCITNQENLNDNQKRNKNNSCNEKLESENVNEKESSETKRKTSDRDKEMVKGVISEVKGKKTSKEKGDKAVNKSDKHTKTDNEKGENVVKELQVSSNADTQPPVQAFEICSNEVTSSGQTDQDYSLEVLDSQQTNTPDVDEDIDGDSFDELLKSNAVMKEDIVNLDTDDSSWNEITVIDKNKSDRRQQTGSSHDSQQSKKRKKEADDKKDGNKKMKWTVEKCRATCQSIAKKYEISESFVSELLFQCSGDINRAVAYIEYGPHSYDLPPWTEHDDRVLAKNPRSDHLILKFGSKDIFKRHCYIDSLR